VLHRLGVAPDDEIFQRGLRGRDEIERELFHWRRVTGDSLRVTGDQTARGMAVYGRIFAWSRACNIAASGITRLAYLNVHPVPSGSRVLQGRTND
jgi:hypothetical protein